MGQQKTDFLAILENVIQDRIRAPKAGSYTSELIAGGVSRQAQKVGEEGVELALAAVSNDRTATIEEAADLIYHLLVLLSAQGITLADVERCLRERHES